jgi:subfamily B ATP-binding cassette protein MsbA
MFIPLFELASNTTKTTSTKLTSYFQSFLDFINVTPTINNILLLMLLFFVLKALFRFLDVYYRILVNSFFITKLRVELLNLISNLKYTKFITTDLGTIQNSLTTEVVNINSAYMHYISVLQNSIFIFVYISMSFWVNSKFTLIIIFGGLISRFIFQRFYSQSKTLSFSITNKNNALSSLLMQQVNNFKYLKSTATMLIYSNKLKESIIDIEKNQIKIGKISARVLSIREPIVVFFLVVAIFIQINIIGGSLTAILPSLLFFYRAFNSLMSVQISWTAFLKYVGSIQHIVEFQKQLSKETETIAGKEFYGFSNQIEFNDVSFQFSNKNEVLTNITYTLPKNNTIAIVGKSGSGKTTLVNLVSGLLLPKNGKILIDTIDLNEYNLNSYRSKIGLISQETVVFNDTLFNNVTFWAEKNDKSLSKFNEVIDKVDLIDFLVRTDEKEDIILGDNGVIMSGGQKQRLSIARELFKDTELLIFDEATSSLDSHTEKLIQESIDRIKGSLTIIIIAHRLSTIKSADSILLLKNGKIDASGNFKDLVQKSPAFAAMVALQEI